MVDTDEDEARRRWFRQQVLPLEARLHGYALRLVAGNAQDAEDLVHDTFLRLLGCSGWRTIDNPVSFAFRAMQNMAIDTIRRRKVVAIDAISDLNNLDLPDDHPGPEETAGYCNELELLAQTIAELPAQCRLVFMLRKVHDLSHRQISQRLGISISTVEKHLAKGLRLCTDRLAKRHQEGMQPRAKGTWIRRNPLHVKK